MEMSDSAANTKQRLSSWSSKQISINDVPEKISNGSSVYIGSCASTAEATLNQLVDDLLENIQIIQMIPGGDLPHLTKNLDQFRTMSFWSYNTGVYFESKSRLKKEGLQDYKPISIAMIPRLLEERKLSVDVAIIKVTAPQKGFVSLGMGVDSTLDFCRHARVVIAEVNENMPWTEGPSKLPISEIDWWLSNNEQLKTTQELWPTLFARGSYPQECLDKIGQHVAKEIPDRATVRFGITPLIHCIFPWLKDHKDLGLHTDIFTEGHYELHKLGVITNKYKTIHRGRSVAAQAHGSLDMYEYLDRNPIIEFHPLSHVSNPQVLGQIDNLISVVAALKVDMTGQVATDSISHKFYGGVWSDVDSIRGAQFSKGGKPIVILPSKSLSGRSNLVFDLPPGTGVCITRADVEYVITEYGTAYLYGKSIRERCLALIDIAHPDFRQELVMKAKEHKYISQSQPAKSFGSIYPSELECFHTTKTQKKLFVRPIKAVDEDNLRDFFHKLSDHSVYLRYFRKLRSMPQRILQRTADVDYASDMAIVALSPPDAFHHEIVGIAQWVSDVSASESSIGIPEMAFQVRDDWQGEGLGSYLFQRLIEIARTVEVDKLKADVLTDNTGMNSILQKSGLRYVRRHDFGVTTYIFDLGGEPINPNE